MRAQFIRGEDPKEQMDIGNKIVQIGNQIYRGARIICHDYNLNLDTIKKTDDEKFIGVEFDGVKPNRLHPYRYWIVYDLERKHFWAGYTNIPKDDIEDQKPAADLGKAMLEIRIWLNKFNWTTK